jgi:hypothetical protein
MTQNTNDRYPTRTVAVADPRTFDGDPYEVAERAVRQLAAILALAESMFEATDKMARNAEMERAFAAHEDPKGSEWRSTPLGRRIDAIDSSNTENRIALEKLAVAAGYNPKAATKE